VLRINQLFRAVYAQPGRHAIAFYYRQQGLLAGLFIPALAWVGLLWVYVREPASGMNQKYHFRAPQTR
jgi:hypothetical protein